MAEFKNDTATIAKMMDEAFMAVDAAKISSWQEELEGIYNTISQRMKKNRLLIPYILKTLLLNYTELLLLLFLSA